MRVPPIFMYGARFFLEKSEAAVQELVPAVRRAHALAPTLAPNVAAFNILELEKRLELAFNYRAQARLLVEVMGPDTMIGGPESDQLR